MHRAFGSLLVLLLGTLVGLADESSSRSLPPELQTRLQDVLQELRQVEETLRPIRADVERNEALVELKRGIESDVRDQVRRELGDDASKLDRLRELERRLERLSGNDSEAAEIRAERDDLRNEIDPITREVRESSRFRERIETYEERVRTAMRNRSSEAETLLARRNALHAEFNRLQREALEAVGGREVPVEEAVEEDRLPWISTPSEGGR